MAFVYRYCHPRSEAVVYIGKTSGTDIDALKSRIAAHKSEEKFLRKAPRQGWKIQYIEGLTPAEADVLETALIAENAGSHSSLNVSKTNWGSCGIIDISNLAWKPYPPESLENSESLLKWFHEGHEDALYYWERCGKEEFVGRRHAPRSLSVNMNAFSCQYLSGVWLCDKCSDEVAGVIISYIRGLGEWSRSGGGATR